MPDVILPVLDEAAAIPAVLTAMPVGYRPIVVDNGSTDASAAIAEEFGAEVISEPRRGFGAACFAGLRAADAEVVCFMDCDGSLDPADLPKVVALLGDGADLAIGARRADRGAWPFHARFANRVLARELRRRTGARLEDIGPMRAARRQSLLDLDLRDRRSGWPLEMVVKAVAAGWSVVDTPVPYAERQGRSKVTGTVRGTIQTIGDMGAILRAVE
ncbi:MAG TPA: glycosyltransferase family 2 protein [Solirubrobacterales bacterium]|jgi:glycosyltransferase involved in cell wall biosynthesis|nr:glycosyltransferase family 2 protein [Solirubrobacterales bacterium]